MQPSAHPNKDNNSQSFFNRKFDESEKTVNFAKDSILNNSKLEQENLQQSKGKGNEKEIQMSRMRIRI